MFSRVCLIAVMGLLASIGVAEAADKKGDKKSKLDPQTTAQLAKIFDQLDRDKDGFLDRMELAKVFRGANAKPAPEYKAQDADGKPSPPPANLQQFPDVMFLVAYDDDRDGKVSYVEFEDAGADYAENAKKTAEQIKKVQEQALKQLQSGKGAKNRRPAGRGSFGNLMKQYGQQPKK